MSWFDDDSADEDFDRAKEGFRDLMERLTSGREAEKLWYEQVDTLIARPELLDEKNKQQLDHLRIDAEGRIETFESKSKSVGPLLSVLTGGKGGSELGDLSGLSTFFASEQINKNRTLIRLIRAKEERDKVELPQPSKAQQKMAQQVQRDADREELIALYKNRCEEQKKKYPDQAESIDKRYRRLIEAAMEDE